MDTHYFKTLFDYNAWANDRVLKRAALVPQADYFAAVDGLSFASLHGTLAHIASGEATWLQRWNSEFEAGDDPDTFEAACDRLRSIDAALQAFVGSLDSSDLHVPITYLGPALAPARPCRQPRHPVPSRVGRPPHPARPHPAEHRPHRRPARSRLVPASRAPESSSLGVPRH